MTAAPMAPFRGRPRATRAGQDAQGRGRRRPGGLGGVGDAGRRDGEAARRHRRSRLGDVEAFGLPLELVEFASSGEIVKAADSGRWTLSFAPVDAERKKQIDFGTDYALGVSTYLVRADSGLRTVDDVDVEGVRVLGVEGTATLRSARRTLTKTEARGVTGLDEALASFRAGEADAVALGRESLLSLLPQLPGARIADGHFHAAGTAVAVPRGRPEALAAATEVLERLKADGTVRAIFDRHGMTETEVAPAGSRS